jgi:hypothetical protein
VSFEAALKSHLQADATLAALVADRIHPVIRPQEGVLPAVTYQVVSLDQVSALGGRSDTLRNIRLQVDCWGKAHSDVLSVESAVRARMDTAATSFRSVLSPGGLDDYEPDTKLYRRMLEFSVWFTDN